MYQLRREANVCHRQHPRQLQVMIVFTTQRLRSRPIYCIIVVAIQQTASEAATFGQATNPEHLPFASNKLGSSAWRSVAQPLGLRVQRTVLPLCKSWGIERWG